MTTSKTYSDGSTVGLLGNIVNFSPGLHAGEYSLKEYDWILYRRMSHNNYLACFGLTYAPLTAPGLSISVYLPGPEFDTIFIRWLGNIRYTAIDTSKLLFELATWDSDGNVTYQDITSGLTALRAPSGFSYFRYSGGSLLHLPRTIDSEGMLIFPQASIKVTLQAGWIPAELSYPTSVAAGAVTLDDPWRFYRNSPNTGAPLLLAAYSYSWIDAQNNYTRYGQFAYFWFDRSIAVNETLLGSVTIKAGPFSTVTVPSAVFYDPKIPNLVRVAVRFARSDYSIPDGFVVNRIDGTSAGALTGALSHEAGIILVPTPPGILQPGDEYGGSFVVPGPGLYKSNDTQFGGMIKPYINDDGDVVSFSGPVTYSGDSWDIGSLGKIVTKIPDDQPTWKYHDPVGLQGCPNQLMTGWNYYRSPANTGISSYFPRGIHCTISEIDTSALAVETAQEYIAFETDSVAINKELLFQGSDAGDGNNRAAEAYIYHKRLRLFFWVRVQALIDSYYDFRWSIADPFPYFPTLGFIWGAGTGRSIANQYCQQLVAYSQDEWDWATEMGLLVGDEVILIVEQVSPFNRNGNPVCKTPSGVYPIRVGNISMKTRTQPGGSGRCGVLEYGAGVSFVTSGSALTDFVFGTDPYSISPTSVTYDYYRILPIDVGDFGGSGSAPTAPAGSTLVGSETIATTRRLIVWNGTTAWDSGATYTAGDAVTYGANYGGGSGDDHRYYAGVGTTVGLDPLSDPTNWTQDDAGDDGSVYFSGNGVDQSDVQTDNYYYFFICTSTYALTTITYVSKFELTPKLFPPPWPVCGRSNEHRPGRVPPGEGGGYY